MLDREQAGAETYTLTVLAADDAIRSRQGTTQVRLGVFCSTGCFLFDWVFLNIQKIRYIAGFNYMTA